MQKYLLAFLCVLCLPCASTQAESSSTSLKWYDNYDTAVSASRTSGKPLVMFFTGSDWCVWCKKLDNEVLETPEFAQVAGDQFIFLMLDFPRKQTNDKLTAQNKQLQTRFDVKGFPTLVILDDQQKLIGTVGYRTGGPKAYAENLLSMVKNFHSYKKSFESLNQHMQAANVDQLKGLFGKAKELCRAEDVSAILTMGMQTEDNRFFLIEKYRLLAEQGQIDNPEALHLKEALLKLDPDNHFLTQYELAVINFESCSEKWEQETESMIAPLTTYIEKFGNQDKQNLWRLQILISQVFLEDNKLSEALDYAKASYETAPDSVQPDIAIMIKNIQSKLLTCAN